MEIVYKNRAVKAIISAVDTLNVQLSKDQQLEKSTGTVLTGEKSTLDSLGFINFIIAVEEKIEDEFQLKIALTDETLISSPNAPFQTIGTLADYLADRLRRDL
jgi:acyl carrier protein